MSWSQDDQGWCAAAVTPKHIKRAKRLWSKQTDEAKGSMYGRSPSARWMGELGELAFASWIEDQGIEHEHDGGWNTNPDFTIGDCALSLKSLHINVPMRHNYFVTVNEEFLDDPVDLFAFTAYEVKAKRVLVLGVIGRAEFKELAKRSKRKVFDDPARRHDLAADQLYPPIILTALGNARVRRCLGLDKADQR